MVQPYFSRFSIDIIDGIYANNRTVTIQTVAELVQNGKLRITPHTLFDFDLMVVDYKRHIKELELFATVLPIGRVFIHSSVLIDEPFISSDYFSTGLSIDPNETIEDMDRKFNLKLMKSVQIMTIVPGFQGSPFMMNLYNKVIQLRELGYGIEIFIDGGVNNKTLPDIISSKATPDFACVGSFLTHAEHIEERIVYLRSIPDVTLSHTDLE